MANKIRNLVMGLIVCFCLISLVSVQAQEIKEVELNSNENGYFSFSKGKVADYTDADIIVNPFGDFEFDGNYADIGVIPLTSVTDADIPTSGYEPTGGGIVGRTYINKNKGGTHTAFIITKYTNPERGEHIIVMQYKNLGGGGDTTGQTSLPDVYSPKSQYGQIGPNGEITITTFHTSPKGVNNIAYTSIYVKDEKNKICIQDPYNTPNSHPLPIPMDHFGVYPTEKTGYSTQDLIDAGASGAVRATSTYYSTILPGTKAEVIGDELKITLHLRLINFPAGKKYIYAHTVDVQGVDSGWKPMGEFDVTGGTGTTTTTEEADLVCLVGDIDNLGFGWPKGFDVFSGRSTPSHRHPWNPESDDPPGTDRIMVGSGAKGSSDGYSKTTSKPDNNPQPITMECDLNGVVVKSATLQMFVDDFQSPRFGSKFQAKINNKRAPFLENVLNSLRQGGPIGKVITVQIPDEFLSDVSSGKLIIFIDDPETGVGDGYAIDFVRLLINPKESKYVGKISGKVTDSKTGQPLSGATVSASGISTGATTGSDGTYILNNVPAGMAVVTVSKTGYESKTLSVDLVAESRATLNFALSPEDITTTPPDPTTQPCTGTSTYAYIESITMQKGKEARIAVMMCNANDLANMDFGISYHPNVLDFKDAEKGSLNANSLFESNEISSGNIKISFASSKGVSGSGSIAVLIFDVIGSNGDSTILTGSVNTASTSSGSPISINIKSGKFTVGSSVPGDCDGDGIVTSKDALAALQMSVGKLKVDLCYDVTKDGKVDSSDAREILKKVVRK